MTNRRSWAGSFCPTTTAYDLVFSDEVDNGIDTNPYVDETLFQIRVEEGELAASRHAVLIVSVLFPGGEIHHRGFTAEQARRIAADLLESAAMVDTANEQRDSPSASPAIAA